MAFQFLRCPACGHRSRAAHLDVEHLLELIEVRGLGYGRGFLNLRKNVESDPVWVGGFLKLIWVQLERVKRKARLVGVNLAGIRDDVAAALGIKLDDLVEEIEPCESKQRLRVRSVLPVEKAIALLNGKRQTAGLSTSSVRIPRLGTLSFVPVLSVAPLDTKREGARSLLSVSA
jgi:hypothetical protein